MVNVTIENIGNATYALVLTNKLNILLGLGGVGKTKFMQAVAYQVDHAKKILNVICDLPYDAINNTSDETMKLHLAATQHVYFIDEAVAIAYKSKMIKTQHYWIVVSRNIQFGEFINGNNTYSLKFYKGNEDKFLIYKFYTPTREITGTFDVIVTEARQDKSENLCIKRCLPELQNVVPADGRGNVARILTKRRKTEVIKRALVLWIYPLVPELYFECMRSTVILISYMFRMLLLSHYYFIVNWYKR